MAEDSWLNLLYPVAGLVMGGGGAVAWYSARNDKKKGIKEVAIQQETAEADYWKSIIETQTKSLLDPLTARVASLGVEVATLEQKVNELSREKRTLEQRERLWMRYADDLVEHIEDQKGPPAPERPVGL